MSAETESRAHLQDFSWWLHDTENPKTINHLKDLAALRDSLTELIDVEAVNAHDSGFSWTVIGEALGRTRQAVQKRYSSSGKLF